MTSLEMKEEFIWSTHQRHISIHDGLQDLHPFCQVLSVDELQGEVVLWRQSVYSNDAT